MPLNTPESFEKDVVAFSELDVRLVRSLASQAAVSVENNALYQRIEKLFDDFVEASVMAIESRDPVTKGHSRRVAKMTVSLARRLNETWKEEEEPQGSRVTEKALDRVKKGDVHYTVVDEQDS